MKNPLWCSVLSELFWSEKMSGIFRWFYCLPIAEAVLLVILLTAVFSVCAANTEIQNTGKRGLRFFSLPGLL